ncbi:MAG TPA: ABC transporter permease subunit [Solirubrobacteraceae bacterium]|nr:ABC transporter permease subunit [Solirubrobacteraceae bacterium]
MKSIAVPDRATRDPRAAGRARLGGDPRAAWHAARARAVRALPALLFALGALALWELYVDVAGVDQLVLPAPHAMLAQLWDNAGLLWQNFTVTAREVVLGLALALLAGLLAAVAIHLSPLTRRAVYPHAVGSQAVPIAILAVPLCFWWGFGILPKLLVISLICFFPVLVTTVDGLARVDVEQLKLLRTLDASRLQAFRFAELPAAIPAAISGARIALAVGVIGAFIAETSTPTIGSYAGLGHQIASDLTALQTARAYAATAVLFVFAIACFYSLTLIEHRIAPWAHDHSKGDPS